jgi:phospholipid/cholesterol/gamma-HCH transport system substrate-binding protein
MGAMASPRSIEVKVGLLILTALGLLAVFVLVMGGINFQPKYGLLVGFDNPGGLQGGAPVRIAGVKVGGVQDLEFVGGGTDPKTNKPLPVVRARIKVEKRYQQSIRDNSVFFITTSGLLGEQYLAIDPGGAGGQALADGDYVRGLDPPRLDQALAVGYDLLITAVEAMREYKPALRDIVDGLAKTLRGTGTFMERNQDRLDRIATNAEQISVDAVETIRAARRQYVDNPKIDRIVTNVDQLASSAAKDLPPLLQDGRVALNDVKRVVAAVGSDEQVARIKTAVDDVAAVAADAKAAVKDARAIVAHVKQGRGSVGALVMDEQLFDDLQEMARDLKHNPWKFFWKE